MNGVITNRHLVTNAATIINEFGLSAYIRCVAACVIRRRKVTFLEIVMKMPSQDESPPQSLS